MGDDPPPSYERLANLAALLLYASDWFNDALLRGLADAGWPALNRSHSLVFASLTARGVRQVDLARRLGMTRQSMHTLIAGLEQQNLVTVRADPHDGRAKRVYLAARGRRLVRDARALLAGLEDELVSRIGRDEVEQLRDVLSREWGSSPWRSSTSGHASAHLGADREVTDNRPRARHADQKRAGAEPHDARE